MTDAAKTTATNVINILKGTKKSNLSTAGGSIWAEYDKKYGTVNGLSQDAETGSEKKQTSSLTGTLQYPSTGTGVPQFKLGVKSDILGIDL